MNQKIFSILALIVLLLSFSQALSSEETSSFTITNVSVPEEIFPGMNFQINVKITGNDWEGLTIISANSEELSISGEKNMILEKGENKISFNAVAKDSLGIGEVEIKVCSVSQFSQGLCNTETKNFYISAEEEKENSYLGFLLVFLVLLLVLVFVIVKKKK